MKYWVLTLSLWKHCENLKETRRFLFTKVKGYMSCTGGNVTATEQGSQCKVYKSLLVLCSWLGLTLSSLPASLSGSLRTPCSYVCSADIKQINISSFYRGFNPIQNTAARANLTGGFPPTSKLHFNNR